jgi:hypothetical protein
VPILLHINVTRDSGRWRSTVQEVGLFICCVALLLLAAQQFSTGIGLRASCQHAAEKALGGGRSRDYRPPRSLRLSHTRVRTRTHPTTHTPTLTHTEVRWAPSPYMSGSACSTVGVHSQAWSTSGIGRIGSKSGRG